MEVTGGGDVDGWKGDMDGEVGGDVDGGDRWR